MPSYAEMTDLFGVRSKNAVAKIVAGMIEAGIVRRDDSGRILPSSLQGSIRLVGVVEAGFPSPAEEELGDCISLDDMLIGNREASFLLTVSGDSMIDAGIMPGDLVVVDRSVTPRSGDVVIALVDGKWTMKYLEFERGRSILRAANPKYPPIVPQEEMAIHGVVLSVMRRYR